MFTVLRHIALQITMIKVNRLELNPNECRKIPDCAILTYNDNARAAQPENKLCFKSVYWRVQCALSRALGRADNFESFLVESPEIGFLIMRSKLKSVIIAVLEMSRDMRQLFCIRENKGADQLTAQLISAFIFATYMLKPLAFLNPKFQASSRFLWPYSPVFVGPGRKLGRQVFS